MNGLDLRIMIAKYKDKGLVIDSKPLLLYFVGLYDPGQIARFKRTQTYTIEDFHLLQRFVTCFRRVVTTPNILTEVSNLSGQLPEPIKSAYFRDLKKHVGVVHERYRPSRLVCQNPHFVRFGLTDSAIVDLSMKKYLVLTDDLPFYGLLQRLGIDAINFSHIRFFGWPGT